MPDDFTVDLTGLDSDYEILSELRQSNRSKTYLARHLGLNRDVTIQVEAAPRNGDNNSLTHFASDARTLTLMRHPNIVPVVEGRWLADGVFAIVRARVRGTSLDETVKADGPFPPSRIASTLTQVLSAIEWARGNGIAHRSLPGDSIIFQQGSGRVFAELDLSSINAGGLPDECDDARTIGSLAYEMLSGSQIGTADARPLTELRPDLPVKLIREMSALMNCDRQSPAPDPNVLIGLIAALPAPVVAPRTRASVEASGVSTPGGSKESETPGKRRFGFGTRLVILAAISTGVGAVGSLLFTSAPTPTPVAVRVVAPHKVVHTSESAGEVAPRRPTPKPVVLAPAPVQQAAAPHLKQASAFRAPVIDSVAAALAGACDSADADDQQICLMNAITRNDRELNGVYRRLIAALRRHANVEIGAADIATVEELKRTQQAWLDARDAACRDVGQGPLYASTRAQCFAQASAKRSVELRQMLDAIADT